MFENFSLSLSANLKKSHPEVFLEKLLWKYAANLQEIHPCRSAGNFIEIALRYGCISCKFAAYFQNTFV